MLDCGQGILNSSGIESDFERKSRRTKNTNKYVTMNIEFYNRGKIIVKMELIYL